MSISVISFDTVESKLQAPKMTVIIRLSDLSNGFPYNATEEAGEMEQQAARDLSGDIARLYCQVLRQN